jgi:hypothetical protein
MRRSGCRSDPWNHELLDRGAMRASTLRRARNKQEPQRRPGEGERGDQEDHELDQKNSAVATFQVVEAMALK